MESDPRCALDSCALLGFDCSWWDRPDRACWKSQSSQYRASPGTGPPQILQLESLNAVSC
jgi:hypothetical protein